MPYAITLCFDDTTEKAVVDLKNRLATDLDLQSTPAFLYAPHITLGIFENLVSSDSIIPLRALAKTARSLRIRFGGIGFFESKGGFTIFISVIPSSALLQIHQTFHKLFPNEIRRDQYYNVGMWLPHCTVASGVRNTVPLEAVFSLFPKDTIYRTSGVTRIELVFAADIARDSAQIIQSIAVEETVTK